MDTPPHRLGLERVVEVFSGHDDLVGVTGSGYVIGPDLVLTSARLTPDPGRSAEEGERPAFTGGPPPQAGGRPVGNGEGPEGSRRASCHVRLPGSARWSAAEPVWRGRGSADVVLLRTSEPMWTDLPGIEHNRWARIASDSPPVRCAARGFAQEIRRGGLRIAETLPGLVSPPTGAVSKTLTAGVPSSATPEPLWRGMCGAVLVAEPAGQLIGVVTPTTAGHAEGRLDVVPVTALLGDERFRELAGVSPGGLETVAGSDHAVPLPALMTPAREKLPPDCPDWTLLMARHAVVPFLGRREELAELRAWATTEPGPLSIAVLSGRGGMGKTRLAGELCVELESEGWDAGFLPLDAVADPLTDRGAVAGPSADRDTAPDPLTNQDISLEALRPTLLVVDHPEPSAPLVGELIRRLAKHGHNPRVRLLLLVREPGEADWWRRLDTAAGGWLRRLNTTTVRLNSRPLTLPERTEHALAAMKAFAPSRAALPSPPRLDDPEYGLPLHVHLAALLRLCDGNGDGETDAGQGTDAYTGGSGRTDTDGRISTSARTDAGGGGLLGRFLRRECDQWARVWPDGQERLPDVTARRAVAVLTLTAPTVAELPGLLTAAVPGIRNRAPGGAFGLHGSAASNAAGWLSRIFPASPPAPGSHPDQRLTPLGPDLLTEQLLATTEGLDALVLAVHDHEGRTVEQLVRMLAVLRSCAGRERVRAALWTLITHRLGPLVAQAKANPSGRLGDMLNAALLLFATDQRIAASVATLPLPLPPRPIPGTARPDPRTPAAAGPGLRALEVTLAELRVRHWRASDKRTGQAKALTDLSSALAAVGRVGEAVVTAAEAVEVYAGAPPYEEAAGRAEAAFGLGACLLLGGEAGGALKPAQEAAARFRILAEDDPRYLEQTARAHYNVACALLGGGRLDEAVAAFEAAGGDADFATNVTVVLSVLPPADPVTEDDPLTRPPHTNTLTPLPQPPTSTPTPTRQPPTDTPGPTEPPLPGTPGPTEPPPTSTFAPTWKPSASRPGSAESPRAGGVGPAAQLPGGASARDPRPSARPPAPHPQAAIHGLAGEAEGVVGGFEAFTPLSRTLAGRSVQVPVAPSLQAPEPLTPFEGIGAAAALPELAACIAVAVTSAVRSAAPTSRDVAHRLHLIATWLEAHGRPADALRPATEAVGRLRTLAAEEPGLRVLLAFAASVLSRLHARLDDLDAAARYAAEAVRNLRALVTLEPDEHRPALAGQLLDLGELLLVDDLPEEALRPLQEAMALPSEPDPATQARGTWLLALCLDELGRPVDGLAQLELAAERYGLLSAVDADYTRHHAEVRARIRRRLEPDPPGLSGLPGLPGLSGPLGIGLSGTGLPGANPSGTGLSENGPSETGPSGPGLPRTGPPRTEPPRTGLPRTRPPRAGLPWLLTLLLDRPEEAVSRAEQRLKAQGQLDDTAGVERVHAHLSAQAMLARAWADAGRPADGFALATRAAELLQRHAAPDGPHAIAVGMVAAALGRSLVGLGRPEEAVPYLRTAIDSYGPHAATSAEFRTELAELMILETAALSRAACPSKAKADAEVTAEATTAEAKAHSEAAFAAQAGAAEARTAHAGATQAGAVQVQVGAVQAVDRLVRLCSALVAEELRPPLLLAGALRLQAEIRWTRRDADPRQNAEAALQSITRALGLLPSSPEEQGEREQLLTATCLELAGLCLAELHESDAARERLTAGTSAMARLGPVPGDLSEVHVRALLRLAELRVEETGPAAATGLYAEVLGVRPLPGIEVLDTVVERLSWFADTGEGAAGLLGPLTGFTEALEREVPLTPSTLAEHEGPVIASPTARHEASATGSTPAKREALVGGGLGVHEKFGRCSGEFAVAAERAGDVAAAVHLQELAVRVYRGLAAVSGAHRESLGSALAALVAVAVRERGGGAGRRGERAGPAVVEQAIDLLGERQDRTLAMALNHYAAGLLEQGRAVEVLAHCERAADLCDELEDPAVAAVTYAQLGSTLAALDRPQAALEAIAWSLAELDRAEMQGAELHRAQRQGTELYLTEPHGTQLFGAELYRTQPLGTAPDGTGLDGTGLDGTGLERADVVGLDGPASVGLELVRAQAVQVRGRVLRALGREQEAMAHLVEALRLFSGLPEPLAAAETAGLIADDLLAAGRPQDAAEYAQIAANGHEAGTVKRVLATQRLAGCHMMLGELEQANALVEELIPQARRSPDDLTYRAVLADSLAQSSELLPLLRLDDGVEAEARAREAIAIYDELLTTGMDAQAVHTSRAGACLTLAGALRMRELAAEAIQPLREAVAALERFSPGNPMQGGLLSRAMLMLGDALMEAGRALEAGLVFHRTTQVTRDELTRAVAHARLGFCQQELGRDDAAEAALRVSADLLRELPAAESDLLRDVLLGRLKLLEKAGKGADAKAVEAELRRLT
ncbi:tetratricopeptide repeat protein [Nonomuraea fuscirosea]|uniref:tetratricopeptide repeat protein n=1 Tax=Nonomuraea fuscirosea TaxID=1291556 RepID=UPI003449258A